MKQPMTLHQTAHYLVEIQGYVDEGWSQSFGMTAKVRQDDPPVTRLTGKVDQAGLHGVLRKIYAIGLPLISVRYMEATRED
jgi:hypothetical protein